MKELKWDEVTIGGIIPEPGSFSVNKTGDWRTLMPDIDKEKCNDCGLCWLFCPDAAIVMGEDNRYEINMYYCKGCGICVKACTRKCITLVEEEE